jgi:hypothetical protein
MLDRTVLREEEEEEEEGGGGLENKTVVIQLAALPLKMGPRGCY